LGLSRSRSQRLIRQGRVRVDGTMVVSPSHRIGRPSWVEVRLPESPQEGLPPDPIPLQVLFENEDVIVLNKPAGLVVHPAAGHARGTLLNALAAYEAGRGGLTVPRGGLVHRLDKDTTGVLVLARNENAQSFLQGQFHDRRVGKLYDALVLGAPPTREGRIEYPIGRKPSDRKRMAVVARGRPAVSTYGTAATFASHSHLEVRPLTGRTHQIRVHLAHLGCPVLGDRVYGPARQVPDVERPMLHARQLEIPIPGESEPRRFEAPLPQDFLEALDAVGSKANAEEEQRDGR
jgi:23S rRNA pseudouridine1911/1915/1917 synthase